MTLDEMRVIARQFYSDKCTVGSGIVGFNIQSDETVGKYYLQVEISEAHNADKFPKVYAGVKVVVVVRAEVERTDTTRLLNEFAKVLNSFGADSPESTGYLSNHADNEDLVRVGHLARNVAILSSSIPRSKNGPSSIKRGVSVFQSHYSS